MKKTLRRRGGIREGIFALVTAVGILLLFLLNLGLTRLGLTRSLYIDLTPEGLYTLTDAMIGECAFLSDLKEEDGSPKKIRMLFCDDPDRLVANESLRTVYFMALAFARVYPNFEVETVNINENPTAVSMYKATAFSVIETDDVILTMGSTYRIASATSFWAYDASDVLYSYNGEYRFVSLLKSIAAVNNPSAYFITGHGETVYDPSDPGSEGSLATESFYRLLLERGLQVKTLDLSTVSEIPEDCALLILNDPTSDFTYDAQRLNELSYVTDTEKIDRYLVTRQGAMIAVKDYRKQLPVLESYLREWGFVFEDALVKDPDASLTDAEDSDTRLIASYDATALYGSGGNLSSIPRVLVENTGAVFSVFGMTDEQNEPGTYMASRKFLDILTTSESAMTYGKNSVNGAYNAPTRSERQQHAVAALSVREETDSVTGEKIYSYLFATSSSNFLSEEVLGNTSFANYDVLSSLIESISCVDEFASMEIGGTSLNSPIAGGKPLVSESLSETGKTEYDGADEAREYAAFENGARVTLTVMLCLLPAAALVIGVAVRIRRKYL